MKTNLFIVLYLLSNIFRTFNVYLFFETFLTDKDKSKLKKYAYIAFYLVISIEYIFVDTPLLTLFLNIIGLVLLSMLYPSSMKKRLLGVGFILALLMLAEAIVASLVGYLATSFVQRGYFSSLAGVVCIPFVSFLFVLIYRKLKRDKVEIPIPVIYWIIVSSVPAFCIYIIVLGFSIENIRIWQLVSIVVIMFGITMSVFVLYEKQIKFFRSENRRNMLEAQNRYYHRQLSSLKEMEGATRSVRHDMKNHLLSIAALAENGDTGRILEYVYTLQELTQVTKQFVMTGNAIIDGLFNMKMYQAQEKGLAIDVRAMIPEDLTVSDEDCTVLFGNLLDNAIENAMGWVRMHVRYDRNCLVIFCENPYVGERRRNSNGYQTSKRDKKNHGMGMQNMKRVIRKYGGDMKICDENNVFAVDILLYI